MFLDGQYNIKQGKKHIFKCSSQAGLGTPFFSILYVTFFSVLKKERSVVFRSFLKFLATYETQKNALFFSILF